MTRVEDWKTGGRLPGLGLKTKGVIPVGIGVECSRRSEDRWRDREACVEAKQSREVAGSVRCSKKKLDENAPECVIVLVINVGVFFFGNINVGVF